MKRSFVLFVFLIALTFQGCFAQWGDTAHCRYNHAFTWQQSIAPAALIATGTAISFSPLHSSIDGSIRDWTQRDGHDRIEIENVAQYIPDASVLLLKACGLKSKHSWRNLVCLEAGSAIIAFSINTGLKHALDVERPYLNVYTSFPSGHTVTAFVGAEMLRREYGEEYPAVAIAGYTIATGVGLMRVYNNRHWASDILAGAGVGILSVSIMYWLAPYLTF
ncbi:MAG: phosphatase PAP2 family protein [Bacteroidales bacterium]|nr:phosphatase PAP2 family protein [Bacteroidales bacterium]